MTRKNNMTKMKSILSAVPAIGLSGAAFIAAYAGAFSFAGAATMSALVAAVAVADSMPCREGSLLSHDDEEDDDETLL